MPDWRRKHDMPGATIVVPAIQYPTTLEQVIQICRSSPPEERLHAAGSHWALSSAAMSDHTFIETHAPDNAHRGMARTLHEVIPNCMNPAFLELMSGERVPVPTFEENDKENDI
jgi:hypothetical protein